MKARLATLSAVTLLLVAACDNVGRAFDPNSKGGQGADDATGIQAVPTGGDVTSSKPAVKVAFPKGSGWPGTVPAVVVFSSSMSQDSISPTGQGAKPTVYVRAKGTETAVAASYDFLVGGTVVLIRPLASLPKTTGTSTTTISYEIVVEPEARDIDARRFGGSAPTVVAEFTPDQDITKVKDAQVVCTLPEDTGRDVPREASVFAIFSKPATTASVTTSTFLVGPRGGTALAGTVDFPLQSGASGDGRVARFRPTAILPAATDVDVELATSIAFGDGKLDTDGKVPISRFTTVAFAAPTAVRVGNFTTGFPDKINANNLETLSVDVDVDATAAAGDVVNVRVYGLDAKTKNATDLNFVERATRLQTSGAQTVAVPFAGTLGSVATPRFSEGTLTFATQLERGSRRSGYVLSAAANRPTLDVTPPTLSAVGPPVGSGTNVIVTELESFAFSGKASERIGEATLTAGSGSAALFTSSSDGRFLLRPIEIGRRTTPLDYTLTMRDAAGNLALSAITGQIVQRGVVTGSAAGGTLVVELYDEATMQPLSGATVLVEPGLPQKPAVGRITTSTGTDGRITLSGLTAPTHTITAIATGFQLKTLLATPAGYVSLPLTARSAASAYATLAGSAVFAATTGATALIGSNLVADASVHALQSTGAAPTSIPRTSIRPQRLHALSAFGGTFEPIATATYSFASLELLGTDGVTLTMPREVPVAGQTLSPALTLLAAATGTFSLPATYQVDFASAGGLDTGALTAKPNVRFITSLKGFPGMTLLGVGYTIADTATTYSVNGSYALAALAQLGSLSPVTWISTEARDTNGNLSRHRRLLLDATLGTTYPTGAPIGVPTISTPSGSSTGSPSVTFQDRLDSAHFVGANAFQTLTATDPAGRAWTLLRQDRDAALGAVTLQLPDLDGLTALATGNWTLRAEATLCFAVDYGAGDFMLEELRRQEVMYARCAPVTFTVN